MKMKRTLSLVLALVMVLGTFTTVLAQPEDAEMEAGLLLEELGVLKGSLEGDLMLEDGLKRQDAVVMLSRLMGDEDVAEVFPGVEEILMYEDLEEADPFYLPYLAWAYANEYFVGHSPVRFGYDEIMTVQQYLNVVLRVLGYDDVDYAEVMEKAVELGLLEEAVENDADLTRGFMSSLSVAALNTNIKDTEMTLAEKLEIEMPAPPTPAALEVEEVVADNLKEVKVMFNQEVDADTVTDANVSVKGEKGSAALLEDGMTVVISMEDALTNQKEYTLIADKVLAVSGAEMEEAEVKFTAFDRTLPEALSVEVTGPRNLTVTFSEPMNPEVDGTLTIKQDKVNLGSSVTIEGNKAVVRAYTNFVEGKEYTVTVSGFEDYAGYKNVVNVLTFTYEKDENPPVATVEKAEQTYVIVSFDKPVTGMKKDNFYHTFTAWTAEKIEDMSGKLINTTDSVDKVKVYFIDGDDGRAIPAGNTVFGIHGKNIKDNWGNALGNQEFTISTTADRTLPEVKSITVKTEKSLEIEFTKDVKFARKNVDILDADGKSISGVYITVDKTSDSKYTVNFGKNLAGKTITVSIKDVEDTSLYKNVLSLYSEVLQVTDKTAPKVTKVYYSEIAKDDSDPAVYSGDLYVAFDEAVDADTALVDTNYALVYGDDVTILEDANTSFDVVNSRVKLSLTSAQAKDLKTETEKPSPDVKMLVINVKDLAGNTIAPKQKDLYKLADTAKVGYTVTATKKDQIEVKFDDILSEVKMNYFKLYDSDDVEFGFGKKFSLTQNDSATSTTLVFDLSEKMDSTDGSEVYFEIDHANHKIENSFGMDAQFDSFVPGTAIDEIKPEIALDGDDKDITVTAGTYGMIKITFTEAMDKGTFSKLSFGVEGKTVKDINHNNNDASDKLTIRLNEELEDGDIVRLIYVHDVKDIPGNNLNLDKGVVVEIEVKAPNSPVNVARK